MPSPNNFDDHDILRRIAQGDVKAFDLIHGRYLPFIYQAARKLLSSKEEAEDLVQDVFLTLLEKDFSSVKQFESYLRAIVRNRCLYYLKRTDAVNKAEEEVAWEIGKIDTSEQRAEYMQKLEKGEKVLIEAIQELTDRRRKIFIMRKFDGLSLKAIANHFSIPEHAVWYDLEQGMKQVSEYVKHRLSSSFWVIVSILLIL